MISMVVANFEIIVSLILGSDLGLSVPENFSTCTFLYSIR